MLYNDIQEEAVLESLRDLKNIKWNHKQYKEWIAKLKKQKGNRLGKVINYAVMPIAAGITYPLSAVFDLFNADMEKSSEPKKPKTNYQSDDKKEPDYWQDEYAGDWKKQLTQPLDDQELFWLLDYSQADVYKLAKNNTKDSYIHWVTWIIEHCEDALEYVNKLEGDKYKNEAMMYAKTIKYCKTANFGCIANFGNGDGLLMNVKDKKIFLFCHEDTPQIEIQNPYSYSELIKESENLAKKTVSPEKRKALFNK